MTHADQEADARRASTEDIIARYPDVQPDELASMLRYLRKEATPHDRSLISTNSKLEKQYRQIGHDHHLNRLSPFEWILVASGLSVLVLGIYILQGLADTM